MGRVGPHKDRMSGSRVVVLVRRHVMGSRVRGSECHKVPSGAIMGNVGDNGARVRVSEGAKAPVTG